MELKDIKLTDIKIVTLYFEDGSIREHMMHVSQMDAFIAATENLHMHPGTNPHNNRKTKAVETITVAPLELAGPFWWTTPDLMNNDDPAGAILIQKGTESLASHTPVRK